MRTLLAVILCFPLLAGTPKPPRKELIHIPVWAQSEAPQAPRALGRETLKVTIGGAAAQASLLLGPTDDLMLLVVMDLTGDLPTAAIAKRALTDRVEALPPKTVVGLLRAQDGLRVLVDPTAERAPVKSAIDALPTSGKSGLLETVMTVSSLGDAILTKAAVRLAVLYVTDSDVYNYREDFTNPTINWSDSNDISRRFRDGLVRERIAKLDASLAATETPFFIVHLAYSTDSLNQAYQTGLMTLAATTGGASYFCRSQAEVSDTIGKVFDLISGHYSLRVPLPSPRPASVNVLLESPGRTLHWRTRFSVGE